MKRGQWIAAISLCAVMLVAAWLWFSSSGTGEYADSPDGRYHVSVSSLNRGTWLHGRINYVEVKITENATGATVWESRRLMLPGETAPEYSDRSKKFITWAPDSRSLSVPVGGPKDAVFAVP